MVQKISIHFSFILSCSFLELLLICCFILVWKFTFSCLVLTPSFQFDFWKIFLTSWTLDLKMLMTDVLRDTFLPSNCSPFKFCPFNIFMSYLPSRDYWVLYWFSESSYIAPYFLQALSACCFLWCWISSEMSGGLVHSTVSLCLRTEL